MDESWSADLEDGAAGLTASWTPRYGQFGTATLEAGYRREEGRVSVTWQYQAETPERGSASMFYEDSAWRDSDWFGPYMADVDGIREAARDLARSADGVEVRLGSDLRNEGRSELEAGLEEDGIPHGASMTGTKIAVADAELDDLRTALYVADPGLEDALWGEPVKEAVEALEAEMERAADLPRWMR